MKLPVKVLIQSKDVLPMSKSGATARHNGLREDYVMFSKTVFTVTVRVSGGGCLDQSRRRILKIPDKRRCTCHFGDMSVFTTNVGVYGGGGVRGI